MNPVVVSELCHVDIDGHRLVYRVAGRGPALVVLRLHRSPREVPQIELLRDRWQVFQMDPLGWAPGLKWVEENNDRDDGRGDDSP